ncbi:hypothetical protein EDEG_02984 [Edhazardia aedis USNM 41457]|uniref:GOLD domain-containing protein n=1 Tax=Edhazardia aedis (strain USNM 41457) TaxID=1003232 RepID=J9D4B3_EDHAE|nr:hypothetical protein EDEG_02984 [Edhazardia aedis USNM 41457]|eukprot:EJW02626.1 hypothetical protein EDEG_02984 [Edhazardia aedis USNM 41457]
MTFKLTIFIAKIICWRQSFRIEPQKTCEFFEYVSEDGLQFTCDMNTISAGDGDVMFQLIDPKKSSFAPKKLEKNNGHHKLSGAGFYTIKLTNTGTESVFFDLGTYVDKVFQKDAELIELDKSMVNMTNIVQELLALVRSLSESKDSNLRELLKEYKLLLLLFVMPIGYILIEFINMKMHQAFFQPKKEKMIGM